MSKWRLNFHPEVNHNAKYEPFSVSALVSVNEITQTLFNVVIVCTAGADAPSASSVHMKSLRLQGVICTEPY